MTKTIFDPVLGAHLAEHGAQISWDYSAETFKDTAALELPTYQLPTLEAYGQTESARLADIGLLDVQPSINVTVNTVTAPQDLGQTIVDALIQYNRSSGPIDILVT